MVLTFYFYGNSKVGLVQGLLRVVSILMSIGVKILTNLEAAVDKSFIEVQNQAFSTPVLRSDRWQ
jgi:hypothetical protein